VTDRKGLEGSSCECYTMIVEEYERLMSLANDGAL
jgi:hypothetical protein